MKEVVLKVTPLEAKSVLEVLRIVLSSQQSARDILGDRPRKIDSVYRAMDKLFWGIRDAK